MIRWIMHVLKPKTAMALEHLLLWYFSMTAKRRRCKTPSPWILVARTDGLGDFILWQSAAQEMRRHYPDKKIALMLETEKPTQELAQILPLFDDVFSVDIHCYVRFGTIFKMRKRSFDTILQPVYSRLSFTDILIFAARADNRVTIDSNGQLMTAWEWKMSNRGYDKILPADPSIRHELVRNGEIMRGLGDKDFKASMPFLPVLAPNPIKNGPYLMVFPAGSWKGKQWPAKSFSEALGWLQKETHFHIYLCGGEADIPICQEIINGMQNQNGIHIAAGSHSLVQTVEAIRGANLVFGNDTGAIHIAAACHVPSVAITADREIGRFLPYEIEAPQPQDVPPVCIHGGLSCRGCLPNGWKECPVTKDKMGLLPCIEVISVEAVCQVLKKVLRGESRFGEKSERVAEQFDFCVAASEIKMDAASHKDE